MKYLLIAILIGGAFYSGMIFQRSNKPTQTPTCGALVKTSIKCRNTLNKAMKTVNEQRSYIESLKPILESKKEI